MKVMPTDRNANAKFQVRMLRNGPDTAGSVKARVKLESPTLTCQPWGSALPDGSMNEPTLLSAVQTSPETWPVMQSQASS